jgi:hypothetical protein
MYRTVVEKCCINTNLTSDIFQIINLKFERDSACCFEQLIVPMSCWTQQFTIRITCPESPKRFRKGSLSISR